MSISLISSVLWVPRGVSTQHPRKYDLSDPAELERIERLGKIKLDDARRDLEALEKGVDGMQVDGNDGEDDGDEWESDSQSGSDSNNSEEDDEDVTPEEKARKMAEKIKKGQQKSSKDGDDDEMSKYNLDNYDAEVNQSSNLGIFSNIKGLSYYSSNDASQDPYITLANPETEDAGLEKEELEILPTDNLLVSAKTQDEVSMLEVHVWEGPTDEDEDTEENVDGNLYVHHDTLLPAMPLCMEWGDCRPSTSRQSGTSGTSTTATGSTYEKGSFVAVGTLDKNIEIWDLDVVEGMFPEAILGDLSEEEMREEEEKARLAQEEMQPAAGMSVDDSSKSKAKKQKKKKKKSAATYDEEEKPLIVLPYAHTDSVLSLSWNRTHRSLLASSSADSTIKLWDLTSPTCQRAIRSFSLHGESKVQSIQWNPVESTVLLSGAWGGGMRIFDTRSPETALSTQLPAAPGARGTKKANPDVESLHWDPFSNGTSFYTATGNGQVLYYDSRNLEKPTWTLDAHDGPCASLDVNEMIQGCFVTGGTDKLTKVWNVQKSNNGGQGISLVTSKDFGVGKVFTTLFSPDDPTTVALAGSGARLQVWDAFSNPGFRKVFGDRLREVSLLSKTQRGYQEGSKRSRGNGLVSVVTAEGGEEEQDDDDD